MKKLEFTEQQIDFALRQAETDTKGKEIVGELGDRICAERRGSS